MALDSKFSISNYILNSKISRHHSRSSFIVPWSWSVTEIESEEFIVFFIIKDHLEICTRFHTYKYKLIICYTISWPCDSSVQNLCLQISGTPSGTFSTSHLFLRFEIFESSTCRIRWLRERLTSPRLPSRVLGVQQVVALLQAPWLETDQRQWDFLRHKEPPKKLLWKISPKPNLNLRQSSH